MHYLDNAATSNPKPSCVWRAMRRALWEDNANPGRSGHKTALRAAEIIFSAREELAALFGAETPFSVIFCQNATMALNTAIFGLEHARGHIVTTAYEHNSVLRPLHALRARGETTLSVIEPDASGQIHASDVLAACKSNTTLVAVNHVSNVNGAIQPIRQIGEACRARRIPFLVDASQSAGICPLDMRADCIDLLACPGHKSLYGPQGTGALIVRQEFALRPLLCGGTGSQSHVTEQPEELPDRLESGTLNTPGIAGLAAGVRFVRQHAAEIREHEAAICAELYSGLANLRGARLFGPPPGAARGSAISFLYKNIDVGQIADTLDRKYNIAVRSGLHCAPLAHRAQGTLQSGTVRVSPGFFTTRADVRVFLRAIGQM